MPGKEDPWLAGIPIPGVKFAHNTTVEIIDGEHAGKVGWLVVLTLGAEPTYTVELESGEGDVEVKQSRLREVAT